MNPILMLKPYLYGALAIAILSALGYVYWLHESNEENKATAISERQKKEAALSTINGMVEYAKKEAVNRETYLADLETNKNERIRLETCIADKSCVPTVRVRIKSACTANTAADPAGTETATAELAPETGRAYTNLRTGIMDLESKYRLCQNTLNAWAN